MADLIDRDALLKDMGLTDAVKYGNKDAEQQYRSYSTWMSYEIADSIRDAPAVNRWIPCIERLPEKHVEVLAYSPYWGKIVVAMWGGEFWLEQWTDDDLEQSEITHWMPLPEPPEGGADDAT